MAILFGIDNRDDEVVAFFSDTANGGTPAVLRRFDAPSGLRGLQGGFAHGSFLSMIDWPSKDIFRVPANTANGATISASDVFRWNMSSSVTNPLAVAVAPDGTFYVANEAADDEIVVLTPPTVNNGNATEVRKFDMPPAVTAATGMTISPDGATLYVGNQPNRKIVAFPANTANGETPAAADVHEITLPADATSTQGITHVDGELHVADLGGFISVITADTDDWGTATRSRKYNHPAGIGQIRGIAAWNAATVTLGTPVHVTGNRWHVRATLSGEGLSGFDSSDVSVDLGTVNAVVNEGNNVYRIEVDAPATGSGTVTVTVRAGAVRGGNVSVNRNFTFPPLPLAIEAIDEQFIVQGTKDYRLVIDITGQPDTAKASGHMEGFGQHWDAENGQLHIKAEDITRLINGVNWDIEAVKDVETLMRQIAYNVVQAAPIFASLETIHLYRGVPINFDIVIQNIPPLLIPDAELLGLKSELLEYGINVKGQISATDHFSFNTGNVKIIVPSETGGADTVYNYPYEIEAGSPPQIESPVFTPKGGYGKLEFTDVTHALGYEWTLQEGDQPVGDQAVWNTFDSTRQMIDPSEVEVIPGNLQVTIKFPNIPAAASYEYRLESENHEVDWTRFTGTLADGTITTIIPNLQEGVAYDLWIRVGAPWQGVAIRIRISGGRMLYTLHDRNADSYIIETNIGEIPEFESGQPRSTSTLLRKIFLPAEVTQPTAILVVDQTVYCVHRVSSGPLHDQHLVYRFSIDGIASSQRISTFEKFTLGVRANGNIQGIDIFDSELYLKFVNTAIPASQWPGTYNAWMCKADPNTANGATAAVSDFWGSTTFGQSADISVTADYVYAVRYHRTKLWFDSYVNVDGNNENPTTVITNRELGTPFPFNFKLIGNHAYIRANNATFIVIDINQNPFNQGNKIRDFFLPDRLAIVAATVLK